MIQNEYQSRLNDVSLENFDLPVLMTVILFANLLDLSET